MRVRCARADAACSYPTSTDHSKDVPDSASGEAWYPNVWTANTTTLLAFVPSN